MLQRQSLRYRISFSIALVLLTVAIVFGTALAIFEIERQKTAIQDIQSSLERLSLHYSEQLGNEIFADQIMAIEASLAEIMDRKHLVAITVYNDSGQVLVSSEPSDRAGLDDNQIAVLRSAPITQRQAWNGESVFTFITRISAYGVDVGFWKIHYSLATLKRQSREIILIFVTLLITLASLIGFMLNRFLGRYVLMPVYRLSHAMQRIQGYDSAGGRESDDQPDSPKLGSMIEAFDKLPDDLFINAGRDEIGSLSRSFRQMLLALKRAYIRMRTDPLTGLSNRMRLDETLKSEFDRAHRYRTIFSVVMMDIDFFKKVNDTYGHLIGDEVLRKVASLMGESLRSTDLPGRWGGEEFLILLPHQDLEHALLVAEKLRVLIEETVFPEIGRVTASFGVAAYASEKTVSDLICRADEALYKAKGNGRNRVEPARPSDTPENG